LQEWQFRCFPYLPRLREIYSGVGESRIPTPMGPPDYFEKTMTYAQQWFNTCRPILPREEPRSREWLRYAILQTAGLAAVLAAKRAYLGDSSATPGLFEPKSTAVIKFGSRIVQNPYYRKTFTFDTGLIECLQLVCMMCWKKEICEEALRLLKLAKGRTENLASADIYTTGCEAIL
jgi:hypothetical protein